MVKPAHPHHVPYGNATALEQSSVLDCGPLTQALVSEYCISFKVDADEPSDIVIRALSFVNDRTCPSFNRTLVHASRLERPSYTFIGGEP